MMTHLNMRSFLAQEGDGTRSVPATRKEMLT